MTLGLFLSFSVCHFVLSHFSVLSFIEYESRKSHWFLSVYNLFIAELRKNNVYNCKAQLSHHESGFAGMVNTLKLNCLLGARQIDNLSPGNLEYGLVNIMFLQYVIILNLNEFIWFLLVDHNVCCNLISFSFVVDETHGMTSVADSFPPDTNK